MRVLPFVLSVVAGATDMVTFLSLNSLFSAHITGNMVILAARIVTGNPTTVATMISVPVFLVVLLVSGWLAIVLERAGHSSLRWLLIIEFACIAGALFSPVALLAGVLAVSAMAVQNALVQESLKSPSTAAMTANVTSLGLDLGRVIAGGDPDVLGAARNRIGVVLPLVLGFTLGAAVGAWSDARYGFSALALPLVLAALAVILGWRTATSSKSPSTSEG